MVMKAQSKPEQLSNTLQHSSVQSSNTNVYQPGIAPTVARNMISQKFDKPVKAMKVSEVFDTYFKG